jgi:hypothetical protein
MTRRVSDMTPEQHAQHLATRKRYRLANPEKVRAARARVLYRKTHPDKVRESTCVGRWNDNKYYVLKCREQNVRDTVRDIQSGSRL